LSFVVWASDFAGIGGVLEDGDGDSLSNLLEYALLANPTQNSLVPLPVRNIQSYTVNNVADNYLTLTFTRRTDASDLQFNAEFALSLSGAWSPGILMQSSSAGSDSVTETWRSPQSISAQPRQFGRLRVVKP
jgi:hypothetical protein